jgi:hypothetical protein
VPQAILWREGPESFFACSLRFPPAEEDEDVGRLPTIDLGPLGADVYEALVAYLLTDVVREDHTTALAYAADVFLLDRLASRLQRRPPTPRLCLNCRTWLAGGAEDATPCRFRPARRMTPAGAECTACDRRAQDCRCLRRLPQHVFPAAA